MPDPCFPYPRSMTPERVVFHRLYLDPLGEPMTGVVTVTAIHRIEAIDSVTPAGAPGVVELVNGLFQASLQPGNYRFLARVWTASGHELTEDDTVTVTAG